MPHTGLTDLPDYSRVSDGRLRLELRETAVIRVVEAAVDAMPPAAKEKGVYLNAVCSSDAGRAGEAELDQALADSFPSRKESRWPGPALSRKACGVLF